MDVRVSLREASDKAVHGFFSLLVAARLVPEEVEVKGFSTAEVKLTREHSP